MSKLVGWAVAVALGVVVGLSILYVVGETIDTITESHNDPRR